MNKQYFLFDLDGTLTNPKEGITNCIEFALSHFGIKVDNKDELIKFIGPPLIYSFKTFYNMNDKDAEIAVKKYRERFETKGLYENELFDEIPRLLNELKSKCKTLIVATSKPEVFATKILEHFDILKYFDFVSGAELDGTRNDKADVIEYAIKNSGIKDVSTAIMIGDREHDIIGANIHNMESVGVLYGFGSIKEFKENNATL